MMNLTPRINKLEPNVIIDGGMEIWPEGTSRSVANNTGAYGSVLFRLVNDNTGITLSNSRQTAVPSGTNLVYSNQVSKTAAGTLSASTASQLFYNIEGYDLSSIYNSEFSVIFFVKSSVASNRSISIRNGTATHSLVRQYNISAANTWELKAVRFPKVSDCPGTIDRTNGRGLYVTWCQVAGSNWQTATLNQWVAGNLISGIGEDTTWLTGTNHDFNIAGVMVLPGDWENLTTSGYNFVRAGRNFQEEVAMSQRYFEKSYNLDVTPGTVILQGSRGTDVSGQAALAGSYLTRKRTSPTHTFWNPDTGTQGEVRYRNTLSAGGAGAVNAVPTQLSVGDTGYVADGASQDNFFALWHFTADARF